MTGQERLKDCLKEPLKPKQPTDQFFSCGKKFETQDFKPAIMVKGAKTVLQYCIRACPAILFYAPRRNFGWHIKIAPSVGPSVRANKLVPRGLVFGCL